MNVIDRLQKIINYDDPNTLKYQIAEYLLFNQNELAHKSMREIASHIHTSAPSILRFVQSLNYDNLEDFQYYYSMNVDFIQQSMAQKITHFNYTDEQKAYCTHLDKLIEGANTIVICGGMYEISSLFLAQSMLIHLNKRCYIMGFDNYEEQLRLLNSLTKNDLVITVSLGMPYEELKYKNINVYAKGGVPSLAFNEDHHHVEFIGHSAPITDLMLFTDYISTFNDRH